MLVINDTTSPDLLFPKHVARGLDLSSRPRGYAYSGTAEQFPQELLIPRSEWQARIEENVKDKSQLSDICTQAGLVCKSQAQTQFCWANAPTYCTEVLRVIQNQKPISLSPASVAAPITGYKNVGGWGKTALEWIIANGIVPSSNWPDNAIERKYATPGNKEIATSYRVDEWYELEPRNLDQLISMLLMGFPVAVGYNFWSHEVSAIDPVWIDGTVAVKIRNSWGMGWGDKGYAVLQGQKMLPDDCVSPRTTKAS